MSAKERHKVRVKERLGDKLKNLTAQEEVLHSIIRDYVAKAVSRAEEVMGIDDTSQFLQSYGGVEQLLDRVNNTCELLTASAEDMIESGDDTILVESLLECSVTVDKTCVPQKSTAEIKGSEPSTLGPVVSGTTSKEVKANVGMLHPVRDDKSSNSQAKRSNSKDNFSKTCDNKSNDNGNSNSDLVRNTDHIPRITEDNEVSCGKNKNRSIKETQSIKAEVIQAETKLGSKKVPSTVKKQFEKVLTPVVVCQETLPDLNKQTFDNNVKRASSPKKGSSPKKKTKSQRKKLQKDKTVLAESHSKNSVKAQSDNVDKAVDDDTCIFKSNKDVHTEVVVEETTCTTKPESVESCLEVSQSCDGKKDATISDTEVLSMCEQKSALNLKSKSKLPENDGAKISQPILQTSSLTGKMTPVLVSEIISPWCFFVQQNGPQLDHFMEQICVYMSKGGLAEPHLGDVNVGTVCLAKFSKDNAFYRAFVTVVHSETGDGVISEVDVLYIDYGNKETVRVNQLRRLPEQFTTFPSQAICCALAEVMPSNKYMVWTEEDIFTFKQYVFGQQLNCRAVCHSSISTIPYLVQLIGNYPMPAMPQGSILMTQIDIGQLLVNRGSVKQSVVTDQISLLMKSGEGMDEAFILNHEVNSGSAGVEITELNDSFAVGPVSSTEPRQLVKDKENINSLSNVAYTRENDREVNVNPTKETLLELSEQTGNEKFTTSESVGAERDVCPVTLRLETSDTESQSEEGGKAGREQKSDIDRAVVSNVGLPRIQEEGEGDREGSWYAASKQVTVDSEISETMSSIADIDTSEKSSESCFQAPDANFDLRLNPQGQEVMLAHVKSPADFYIHIISQEVGQTLDKLMKSLNKHFEKLNRRKLTKLSKTFEPSVNKLCCAQFLQDNNFYRALIKSAWHTKPNTKNVGFEPESHKVRVHYIDFGDEEWLPKRRLFPLPPEYSHVPPLAVHCNLAYIKPAQQHRDDTEQDNQTWSERSVNIFTETAGFEKTLHMHVVNGSLSTDKNGEVVGEEDSTLGVLLVDNTGTEEVCINLDLIRLKEAQLDTQSKFPKEVGDNTAAVTDWNPMEEDFFSKRNSYNIDVDDAGVATTGYKAQDEKTVCKFYSSGRRCWRGDRCQFRHVLQTDSGVSLDRGEVYAVGNNQQELLPDVHSWVAMDITTILTPGHFYALLPMGSKSLDGTGNDKTNPDMYGHEETLDSLLTALNSEYDKRPSHEGTLILKAPGEIVAARFSHDHQWYRARVIQVTEDKVKVFFLDFGNTEWIPEEETADIKPEFLHLPFQALECFLHNVEPVANSGTWPSESSAYFRELVDGTTLVAHVKSRSWNGCLWVELYDTSSDEDINIGEQLIQKGHAVRSNLLTDSSCNVSDAGSSRRSSVSGSILLVPG